MSGSIWMKADDWKRSWKPWIRGTLIGFPFGSIPAGGAEIPTFLSYAIEKKLAKNPEEFGQGAIEGVAGPEAANNASSTGAMVPLLTLGLPTSATAAILLSAFQQYGLQPGPAALRGELGARVGPHRELLRRQRDAARAEPAAGRALGEAPRDPQAAALRGHPRLRHHGRLRHAPVDLRRVPALRGGAGRVPHAPLRFPVGAGYRGHDPGPACGGADAPRARHQPGRAR